MSTATSWLLALASTFLDQVVVIKFVTLLLLNLSAKSSNEPLWQDFVYYGAYSFLWISRPHFEASGYCFHFPLIFLCSVMVPVEVDEGGQCHSLLSPLHFLCTRASMLTPKSVATLTKFFTPQMWHLFESGVYLKVGRNRNLS